MDIGVHNSICGRYGNSVLLWKGRNTGTSPAQLIKYPLSLPKALEFCAVSILRPFVIGTRLDAFTPSFSMNCPLCFALNFCGDRQRVHSVNMLHGLVWFTTNWVCSLIPYHSDYLFWYTESWTSGSSDRALTLRPQSGDGPISTLNTACAPSHHIGCHDEHHNRYGRYHLLHGHACCPRIARLF